jgi:hypothetical protein
MSRLGSAPPVSQAHATMPAGELHLPLERLADCVRALDPASRALLDLSVRRGMADDTMAPLLRTDPFHLAWRRARALERVATEVGREEPAPLAAVRAAIELLPGDAFVERPALPAPEPASTSVALVPLSKGGVDARGARRLGRALDRLDAFAGSAPTLRSALRGVALAVAARAVRTVVWRRRTR